MRLKTLIFAASAAVALTASAAAPRYIFYYIGDGMGMGPSVAAEMYNRQVVGNPQPITMMQFPVSGFCTTYSASSPVTDSAAAGTALATGHKTRNGMLGMDADTVSVNSVARLLKDDGYGIGIITSVASDDATPGAFYAHVPHRSMAYDIDLMAADCGYEFLAGAGIKGTKDRNGDPTDVYEVFKSKGVDVVRDGQQLAQSTSERIYLLANQDNDPGNIGYTIDSIADAWSLPQITQACLDHLLKTSPDRFFMMVEGGNIDHALHANDGGAAIKEILNFNQALDIAYEFYKQHPDETLIVVTADHDTGGMSIGNRTTGYWANLNYIDYQKVSKERFEQYCRSLLGSRTTYTWDDMRQYLADNFGFWGPVPVTEKQEKALQEKFEATFELRNSEDQKTLYKSFNAFAAEVFRVFNDQAGIGFIATSHTGNPVPVFAIGDGAQRFSSLNNNIDIPVIIYDLATGKQLIQ